MSNKQFRRSKQISVPIDFAMWLAGFFDGEGCLFWPKYKKYPQLSITQASPIGLKTLKEIQKALGLGNIYGRARRKPEHQERWELRIFRVWEVKQVLELIAPFLRVKRQTCNDTLQKLNMESSFYQRIHWTAEEIAILEQNPDCSLKEFHQLLPHRSLKAISLKALRVRLAKEPSR
jgi:hypothetical protein